MTQRSKTTLQSYFQTGDRPTQAQFTDLIDSFQGFAGVSVLDYGAVGDGVTDDTEAFEDALASGDPILIPAGVFVIGDLLIPDGASLFGFSGKAYSTTIYGLTVFRRKSGATTILDVSGADGYNVHSICLDGVDKGTHGIVAVTADSLHGIIENCSARFCSTGFGGTGANYMRSAMVAKSNAVNGAIGMTNIIDSHISTCIIAANTGNGLNFSTGVNDCMVTNCKIEFNQGYGVQYSGANNHTITGCIIDRNYKAGIRFQAAGNCTATGNVLRRNGRNAIATERSHILFSGACDGVSVVGNVTQTGEDDGGGGGITPACAYEWESGHTCTNMVLVGNDFTGFVTAEQVGTPPTTDLVIDNNAGQQLVVGQAINKASGRVFQSSEFVSSITAGGTGVYNMTQFAVNTFSGAIRELAVQIRNTSSGADYLARFNILVQREGGAATITASAAYGEIGGAGAITVAGAGTVCDLVFGNIATDGSTFDITLTNNLGANTIQGRCELK